MNVDDLTFVKQVVHAKIQLVATYVQDLAELAMHSMLFSFSAKM